MSGVWLSLCLLASAADAGVALEIASDAGVALDAGAPAAVVDAGAPTPAAVVDAGVSQAASEVPEASSLPAFPALVNEQPSPLVFRLALGSKDARTRAREASVAMEAALTAGLADAPLVGVETVGDIATVRVKGRAVATLTGADARAEGAQALAPWAEELETRLVAFVSAEERRHGAQQIALRVFLSVAIALLALLTLRALASAFARLERTLEERRDAPQPLKLFGVALLSGEALRGVTLVLAFVGRIVAYLVVVAAAVLFMLSQFDATRPWVGRALSLAVSPLVTGADAFVRALPGLALAALLAVVAAAALRLARLLLDDIGAGRVPSRIDRARVRPLRALLSTAVLLVGAPLIVGAAFLRFGTPLETLTLLAGGAVALASVPVLASAIVGGAALWRARVRLGDWVTIGGVEGEVSAIDLLDVTLVPASGGTALVPMIALAVTPVRRHARTPTVDVELVVDRDRGLDHIEAVLTRIAREVDAGARVEWRAVHADALEAVVHVPLVRVDARSALVRALAAATEKSELSLRKR